ncbi:MAG: TlpA family protein disulfide reductase [Parasporobacterium sp.]|nr:TlpA family protein disulfide reductase [Parasporobacterium sp.]
MKKTTSVLITILSAVMLINPFKVFAEAVSPYYSSPEEVTAEKLRELTTPACILNISSGFSMTVAALPADADNAYKATMVYKLTDGLMESSSTTELGSELISKDYFSSDPSDRVLYRCEGSKIDAEMVDSAYIDSLFEDSLLFKTNKPLTVNSVTENNGRYTADVSVGSEARAVIEIDPVSGLLEHIALEDTRSYEFDFAYDENIDIDRSPKTMFLATGRDPVNPDEIPAEEADEELYSQQLVFSTRDYNGNPVTEDIMKDAKVVLLNFWEPYCGPCVIEMPDLQKLYDKYKDQGLLVIGVYASDDEEAGYIVEDLKISYPILKKTEAFEPYTSSYVPTTVLLDNKGTMLPETGQYVNSRSFDGWESLVVPFLEQP